MSRTLKDRKKEVLQSDILRKGGPHKDKRDRSFSWEICGKCNGYGRIKNSDETEYYEDFECHMCQGEGIIIYD